MNIRYTQIQKGKRYRFITDDSLVFDKGEVVVALEDSYISWCIRESEYKENFNDINDYSSLVRDTACDVCSDEDLEALEDENYTTAIIDQLKKYKQTGMTPEQIIDLQKKYTVTLAMLTEYHAIGTVAACREAVEKQQGVKPIKKGLISDGFKYDCCPYCSGYVSELYQYCVVCGRKLDWVSEANERSDTTC